MLTKPQAFYDNIHKQALGYQNPFYLRKAQRIKPTLYDGIVTSDNYVAMPLIDDEETLILEEESRSKMSEKEKDPEAIKQNISHKPIDYEIWEMCFYLLHNRIVDCEHLSGCDVLLTVVNSMSLIGESVNMVRMKKESCDKCFNLETELLKSQNVHNDLLKSYSQLEKHCISLELSIQLNQEIFQKDESCNNQNALEIPEFFEKNDLNAQLQDKNSTICKLKDIIKSMEEKSKDENVNYDYGEIVSKNVELENSVAKLTSKNERLCNEINHVKQADILREIVNQAKAKQALDSVLGFACKHAQRIQELLVYIRDTCPNANKLSTKKAVVTPKNNVKKVRFAEPVTSSSNIKQVESSKSSDF
ncbi:hypothetical protein Tco_0005133 [Tanacetum coccineum]